MKKSREDVAAARFEIISPLLSASFDAVLRIEKQKEVARHFGKSYRTIGRWLKAYEISGFSGLKPKKTCPNQGAVLPENQAEILEAAITLRRECPSRSVRDIIQILELEDIAAKGALSRSTLQRHLQQAGFGMRQIRLYAKHDSASRRFAKSHRCMLYQGDIKYGPYLLVGTGGQKKQTYLAAWIDDATRFVVGAKFYTHQKVDIIEDTLRDAILTYGKPESIYVDNGKQYRSTWLQKACAKLGITLLYAKPYHPEGKGKIEAFNRRLDSFLAEIALQKPNSLEELNHCLSVWLQEKYHKDPHAGLAGVSPETAYLTDKRPLSFPDIEACREAFLHMETREVDKAGCISFAGQQYEVGLKLVGRKVEVFYDATWQDEVEIHHQDFPIFKAKRLQIGENCGQTELFPTDVQPINAENSRLLTGLEQQAAKSKNHAPTPVATRFRNMAKELNPHV
jgi:transposase InsO family protein